MLCDNHNDLLFLGKLFYNKFFKTNIAKDFKADWSNGNVHMENLIGVLEGDDLELLPITKICCIWIKFPLWKLVCNYSD